MKVKQAGKIVVACMAAAGALLVLPGVAAAQQAVHYPAGKSLFDAQCAVCHQVGGKGQDGLAPPLTEYPGKYATADAGRAQLVATLLHGMFGEIKVHDKRYNFKMPSFASASDDDIANVLNYVVFDLNDKHGDAKPFTAADIRAARAKEMDGTAVHAQRAVVTKGLGL
ncbi:c-type cytochrome [Burkholderia sp. IMCC1007]|uniref:c-type cytochrome n=1 Tax=Burkholderia sp. IMCC1007 TaxID=3004104 RepID=UPI0022B52D33|nr:cytochrome c [Burkholderia sp. IMCC1007]